MAIHTETEAQAEIANRINRASIEIAGDLAQLLRSTERATDHHGKKLMIGMEVQTIASLARKLAEQQDALELLIEMAHVVALPLELIQQAAGTEKVWFRPAV